MVSFTTCLSRNLWQEVTHYLRLGDMDAATEQKRRLEEKQRVEERKRETLRTPWRPKYFIPEVTLLLGSGPEQGHLGFYCSHSWMAEGQHGSGLGPWAGIWIRISDRVFLHLILRRRK